MRIKNRISLILEILLSRNPDRKLKSRYLRNHIEHVPSVIYDNKILFGKNVLVTGAGPMTGSGIAVEMAKQGANIYFTDIKEKRCSELEIKLDKFEVKYKSFVSDITDTDATEALVRYFTDNQIDIDILVNNVGVNLELDRAGISGFDEDKCRKTYETNVLGAMDLTKRIVHNMVQKNINGNIIYITSVNSEIPGHWPIYSSSKSALNMLIKELATELAGKEIRVNGIEPGRVKTDEKGRTLYSGKNILHKSTIDPSYIGRAAVYLASEYFSKHTTGSIIKIDSGQTLKSDL